MASTIARTSEYLTASVAIVLVLACLVSACSSSPPPPDTTGSISRTQVSESRGAPLPPAIQAPATVPVARTASYTPPQRSRRQIASCEPKARYDRRDVTASIPPTRSAYPVATPTGNRRYVVHTIAPHETLYSISRRYHSDIGAIAAVNRVSANTKLQYGELLVIPDPR